MDESEIVKKNYDENAALEWGRLEGFHFEFEITKSYLQKYLRERLCSISAAARGGTACGSPNRGTRLRSSI